MRLDTLAVSAGCPDTECNVGWCDAFTVLSPALLVFGVSHRLILCGYVAIAAS